MSKRKRRNVQHNLEAIRGVLTPLYTEMTIDEDYYLWGAECAPASTEQSEREAEWWCRRAPLWSNYGRKF